MVAGRRGVLPAPHRAARARCARRWCAARPTGGSFAMYTTLLLALSAARRVGPDHQPLLPPRRHDARRPCCERVRPRRAGGGARARRHRPQLRAPGQPRASSATLLRAGVEIYEYTPALLHAKTMVIDGGGRRSAAPTSTHARFALNEELNVVVYDRGVARQLEADLRGRRRPREADRLRHVAQRGIRARLFELVVFPVRDML